MGVYIKGMDMPKSCWECAMIDRYEGDEYWCAYKDAPSKVYKTKRAKDCPLIEIPEHARLIDVNRFEVIGFTGTEGREDTFDEGVKWLAEQIDNAPTVIEGE